MKDTFSTYAPIVNFLYFGLVLLIPMFYFHPVLLVITFLSGISYRICQQGWKRTSYTFCAGLMAFLISAVVNPLFNHQGVTALFYLWNGNPVTLESALYGVNAGLMLCSVIIWFGCFHQVMTSDKLIQLSAKTFPAFSLLFTMTLRFVPTFTEQIKKVSAAQKCIGTDVTEGSLLEKIHHGLRILSITITWAFEHSIETADSMKSRGYGLSGRRPMVSHRFDRRDGILTIIIFALAFCFFTLLVNKALVIRFYPDLRINALTRKALCTYLCYGILCYVPVILGIVEELKWHYLKSNI